MMSSICHRCILKLGRAAVGQTSLCWTSERGRELQTSSLFKNRTGVDEETVNDSETNGTNSSSYHRQFHRNAYERKRSSYQENRSNRTTPLVPSAPVDHYQRLNVDSRADASEIKAAYYSLSKQYHPDIVGKDNPNAAEHFRLITESYDILCDSKLRAEYDSSRTTMEQAPTYTAWRPSNPSSPEQDHLYRMREAGRIFRSKQEEALAREKLKNPKKFRAGVFKSEDIVDGQEEIERVRRRIDSLQSYAGKKFSQSKERNDGSDFYRMHLYETMQRRREDLKCYQSNFMSTQPSEDSSLIVSLLLIVGLFGVAVAATIGAIYQIDLPEFLDKSLEKKIVEMKARRKAKGED